MHELLYVSLDSGNVYTDMPNCKFRCFSIWDHPNHVEGQLLTHFEPPKVWSIVRELNSYWHSQMDVTVVSHEFQL